MKTVIRHRTASGALNEGRLDGGLKHKNFIIASPGARDAKLTDIDAAAIHISYRSIDTGDIVLSEDIAMHGSTSRVTFRNIDGRVLFNGEIWNTAPRGVYTFGFYSVFTSDHVPTTFKVGDGFIYDRMDNIARFEFPKDDILLPTVDYIVTENGEQLKGHDLPQWVWTAFNAMVRYIDSCNIKPAKPLEGDGEVIADADGEHTIEGGFDSEFDFVARTEPCRDGIRVTVDSVLRVTSIDGARMEGGHRNVDATRIGIFKADSPMTFREFRKRMREIECSVVRERSLYIHGRPLTVDCIDNRKVNITERR